MTFDEAWELFLNQGVRFWLDRDGQLRIQHDVSPEIRNLVRLHKRDIIAVLQAQSQVNRSGVRLLRRPSGSFALAKPPGAMPAELRDAIRTLKLDHLPIFEGSATPQGGVLRWATNRRMG